MVVRIVWPGEGRAVLYPAPTAERDVNLDLEGAVQENQKVGTLLRAAGELCQGKRDCWEGKMALLVKA